MQGMGNSQPPGTSGSPHNCWLAQFCGLSQNWCSWAGHLLLVVLAGLIHMSAVQSDWLGLAGSQGLTHMSGGMYWLLAGPLTACSSHLLGGYPEHLYMVLKCFTRAKPGLGNHRTPVPQDSAGQSESQAHPDSRVGKQSRAKLAGAWYTGTHGSWETVNITVPPRAGRDMISANVHTFSVSPLNPKAFEELKILFTFLLRELPRFFPNSE